MFTAVLNFINNTPTVQIQENASLALPNLKGIDVINDSPQKEPAIFVKN